MIEVTYVNPLGSYVLQVRFSDGSEGIADLSEIPRSGVFESWNDLEFFNSVSINPESGTVSWPNEIDFDPYVLYSRVTGKTIDQALELV